MSVTMQTKVQTYFRLTGLRKVAGEAGQFFEDNYKQGMEGTIPVVGRNR